MANEKYVGVYLVQNEDGNITTKSTSIEKFENNAQRVLNMVPGRFGRTYPLAPNDKDGKVTAKRHMDELIKEFGEDFLKSISKSNNTSDMPMPPSDERNNDNHEESFETEKAIDIDNNHKFNDDIVVETDTNDKEMSQVVSVTSEEPQSSISSSNTQTQFPTDTVQTSSTPQSQEINDGQNDFQIGNKVKVGFIYLAGFRNKKVAEIRNCQYLSCVKKEYDAEHIWIYGMDTKDQEIRSELDANKEDKNGFAYTSLDDALQSLGLKTNQDTGKSAGFSGALQSQKDTNTIEVQKLKERIEAISRKIEGIELNIKSSTRNIISDSEYKTENLIKNESRNLNGRINVIDDEIKELPTKKKLDTAIDSVIENIEPIGNDVQYAKETLETLQGKVASIEEVLSKKGLSIQREVVPSNNDAVVIANAKRLVLRLIDDIAESAMAYADNKELIENADANEEQRNRDFLARLDQAKNDAKKEAFVEMLSGYADISTFFEIEENDVALAVLKKYGIVKDSAFYCGAELLLSEEDIEKKHSIATGLKNSGKYHVIQSAFWADNKVIQKAKVEEIIETENTKHASQEVVEDSTMLQNNISDNQLEPVASTIDCDDATNEKSDN